MVGYAMYVVFGDNNGTCKSVNMQYGRAHTDLVLIILTLHCRQLDEI